MIPRLLSGLFGRRLRGIFGYFIGLAALKPGARVKAVLIGVAVAATLHALEFVSRLGDDVLLKLSMAAFVCLAVTIIKARAISPERDQLAASQLIDRFAPGGMSTIRPVERAMPAAAPDANAVAERTTAHPAMVPASPAAQIGSLTWDDDSNLRVLEVGTARIPATAGSRLTNGRCRVRVRPGMPGGVTAHPNDPKRAGSEEPERSILVWSRSRASSASWLPVAASAR
jgi:hypothetical protein